ncbi:unnamed protein product [Paramecium sonneborni]|uniref:Uncharacterized protein n=1 Tax=Paramecium sonneborni TaxID=65129 RepID=A0A8S1R2B3_9CILI|nr:unnamed protein product [Paramecium sonneborni]
MGNKLKNSNEEVTQNINTETTNSIQIIKTNNKWQERIEEYEGIILDSPDGRLIKTILKIEFTKKKKIKYSSSDGSIYRIDQVKDFSKDQEIMLNTEQIKYLQWVGNYDKNQKKYGKWVAIWQGHTLSNIGGFYMKNGEKEGFWMELFEQFQNKARVFQHGEYDNGQKIGYWKYIYRNREIQRDIMNS